MLNGDFPTMNQNSVFKVLKALSQKPNNTTSSTKDLRRIVQEECLRNQQNTRRFDNNQQFDAAEFLSSFLEHMLSDHSYIVNNLFGKNQEIIFCMNTNCNTADPVPSNAVNIVMLPLVGSTLLMCLDQYLTEHEIERDCPHCGNTTASQVTAFTVDPETIIFQLLRFRYSEEHAAAIKIHDEIYVPTRINLPTGALYEIVGTVNHYGQSADSGHYTASLYNKEKDNYYICDDETIYEINSLDENLSRNVYLIIYQRQ
jgi:ubiquitin C-terminal hydrolase